MAFNDKARFCPVGFRDWVFVALKSQLGSSIILQHLRKMSDLNSATSSPPPHFFTHSPPPPPPPPPPSSFTHPPPPPAHPVRKGSRCESIYVHPRRDENYPNVIIWTESKELKIEGFDQTRPSEKTTDQKKACALCWTFGVTEGENKAPLVKLQVNNPSLRSLLAKVLEGYPGLTEHYLEAFPAPFLPFVHRWQDIKNIEATQSLEGEATKYWRLLIQNLERALQDSFKALEAIKTTNHVAFQELCLIFNPGTIVYRRDPSSAGILRKCYLGERGALLIDVEVIDWDGFGCGLLAETWKVSEFEGQRSLDALSVAPLSRLSDEQNIRDKLIERGRKFEHYRENTVATYTNPSCSHVKERVIVNAAAYSTWKRPSPALWNLAEMGELTWKQSMARNMPTTEKAVSRSEEPDLTPPTDEQRLLTSSTMTCFDTRIKTWQSLEVSKLEDVQWDSTAFENLVLGKPHKEVLLATVYDHLHGNIEASKELIGGKGQGKNILLSGPPGVGKTLTAEAVAEHFRLPLYKLGAAELGTNSTAISLGLREHMTQSANLGAILLIDEADMFLGARDTQNWNQRAIVSEFLKAIEEHRNILFLTTNRAEDFDVAAISRMNLNLLYQDLTQEDREAIWKNHLKHSNGNDFNISALSVPELNGRQICQFFRLGSALAVSQRVLLNQGHLETALECHGHKLA